MYCSFVLTQFSQGVSNSHQALVLFPKLYSLKITFVLKSFYAVQASFELELLCPRPPECWTYRHWPPYLEGYKNGFGFHIQTFHGMVAVTGHCQGSMNQYGCES